MNEKAKTNVKCFSSVAPPHAAIDSACLLDGCSTIIPRDIDDGVD